MKRTDTDEEDLLKFIEEGAHRTGKSVEIPSPEGRTAAGWTTLQGLKVQPEVFTMLEQLREHKLFRGKWKTASHVAWSMIYLGLQSCYQFYSKDDNNWSEFRSNFLAYQHSLAEHENEKKQWLLQNTAKKFRNLIHLQLDKGTAFGKYKAWVTLDKAIATRLVVEDVKQYDQYMRQPPPPLLEANMVFDGRAGDYWEKLYPKVGGPLDEDAADLIYTSLTSEYFEELEEANAPVHHED